MGFEQFAGSVCINTLNTSLRDCIFKKEVLSPEDECLVDSYSGKTQEYIKNDREGNKLFSLLIDVNGSFGLLNKFDEDISEKIGVQLMKISERINLPDILETMILKIGEQDSDEAIYLGGIYQQIAYTVNGSFAPCELSNYVEGFLGWLEKQKKYKSTYAQICEDAQPLFSQVINLRTKLRPEAVLELFSIYSSVQVESNKPRFLGHGFSENEIESLRHAILRYINSYGFSVGEFNNQYALNRLKTLCSILSKPRSAEQIPVGNPALGCAAADIGL